MDEVFDLLKGNDLTDDAHAENIIMHRWSTAHILDFKDSLIELIEAAAVPPGEFSLSEYAFLANSVTSGQHSGGGCISADCRLGRVDELARFAALYSDCVYISNYFSDYAHLSAEAIIDETLLRIKFLGDIRIMLRLRPLLLAGVVRFIYPGLHLCSTCFESLTSTFKEVDNRLEKHIDVLEEVYAEKASARLDVLELTSRESLYSIELRCEEDLVEHGQTYVVTSQPSPIIRAMAKAAQSVQENPSKKEYALSKDEILRSGVIRGELYGIARDISLQYLKTRIAGLNLKYLTNRNVDISFLEAVTEDKDFIKYNDVFRTNLVFEMPILQGVPLDSLLDVRQKEHDAFIVYRDTVNEIVNQYVLQRRPLSPLDAKTIYEDLVRPRLSQLNTRVKSITRSRFRKLVPSAAIATGALTAGLCSNVIAPGWELLLYALGLSQAAEGIKSLVEACQTPEEIRNDSFYFLWKISGKSK